MPRIKIDWENFEFRCHDLAHIMTNAKGKSNEEKYQEAMVKYKKKTEELLACSEKAVKATQKILDSLYVIKEELDRLEPLRKDVTLSEACKKHLIKIYTTLTSGRTKDISSKYMEKGLSLEEDAITLYSLYTGNYYEKNTLRNYNGFIQGEKDFSDEDTIFDTKVSWDIFTFDATMAVSMKSLYEWQLTGYMWLYNKKKAKLIYALLDTPEALIKNEERKLRYDFVGTEDEYLEACKEIRFNHTYDDLSIEERIRVIELDLDETKIEQIKNRIIECRKYLLTLNKNKDGQECNESET